MRLNSTADWVRVGTDLNDVNYSYQPSSISSEGNRVWVKVRSMSRKGAIENLFQSKLPYSIVTDVFDCQTGKSEVVSGDSYDAKENRISGFLVGDPRFVTLTAFPKDGSIIDGIRKIVCTPSLAGRLISLEDLISKDWVAIGQNIADESRLFLLSSATEIIGDEIYVTNKFEFPSVQKTPDGQVQFKTQISRVAINCKLSAYGILATDYIDSTGIVLQKTSWPRNEQSLVKPVSPSLGESMLKIGCSLAGFGDGAHDSEGSTSVPLTESAQSTEYEMWRIAEASGGSAPVQVYLDRFPNGRFSTAARIKLTSMKQAAAKSQLIGSYIGYVTSSLNGNKRIDGKFNVVDDGGFEYLGSNGVELKGNLILSDLPNITGTGTTKLPTILGLKLLKYPDGSTSAYMKINGTAENKSFRGVFSSQYETGTFMFSKAE